MFNPENLEGEIDDEAWRRRLSLLRGKGKEHLLVRELIRLGDDFMAGLVDEDTFASESVELIEKIEAAGGLEVLVSSADFF